ncbi:MAG: hypothetical protein LAT66_06500 [Alkalimonas sp.]|nr:hypothetical protein [Alkalimonas sp.]
MTALENSIWVKDGESTGKIAYVVYSTQCGWSQKFYKDTRGFQSEVELRWIPAGARGADYVVEQRTADAVAKAFELRAGSVSDHATAKRAVDYNRNVTQSIPFHFKNYVDDSSVRYPTVIYQTSQGVKAVFGNPPDFNTTIEEIKSTPEKLHIESFGIATTREPVIIDRVASLRLIINDLQEDILVYGAPTHKGPIIGSLKPGFQFDVTGLVRGTDWIEVAYYGRRGPMAYVYDPLRAKLSRLKFQERRAPGHVAAPHVSLAVRSHPHSESPILYTLDVGQQLTRVAEVELDGIMWDVVVVFTDGTKGYIMR